MIRHRFGFRLGLFRCSSGIGKESGGKPPHSKFGVRRLVAALDFQAVTRISSFHVKSMMVVVMVVMPMMVPEMPMVMVSEMVMA